MKKILGNFLKILLGLILLIAGLIATQYHGDKTVDELKAMYANEESEFIRVKGMDIHYRDEGQGPVLLLLHGTGASLHTWDAWVEEMQQDFRVLRLDMPAYGLTGPHPDQKYEPEDYVEVIHDFLLKLGVDSLFIGGNSFGGNISWHYAYEHPERVKKMILVDASGFPQETIPSVIRLARNPMLKGIMRWVTPKFFIRNRLKEVYAQKDRITDETVDRYFDLQLREGNRQAFIDRAAGAFSVQTGLLKTITVPTLIMWGEKDTWIPLDHAYKFNEYLVNSQIITYPDGGHIPMEELPLQTAVDAKDFLRGGEGSDVPELN
ncbi:MAG: alpha/beta hydrolase [Bacteroidota bacterium]